MTDFFSFYKDISTNLIWQGMPFGSFSAQLNEYTSVGFTICTLALTLYVLIKIARD